MLLFWILLTVVVCFFLYLYMIMPNTSVEAKSSLISSGIMPIADYMILPG